MASLLRRGMIAGRDFMVQPSRRARYRTVGAEHAQQGPQMIAVLNAIGFWILVGSPLILALLAFLDAARRPAWAWALAERRQVLWMAMIGGATITWVGGALAAILYAFTARPRVRDAENGVIDWSMDDEDGSEP